MNITRVEREELNKLSAYVFGTSSKWQKILRKCMANPQYRKYQISDGFTIDQRKSKELGKDYRVTAFRAPTRREIRITMLKLKDEKDFDGLSPVEAIGMAVDKFTEGSMGDLNLRLIVPEDEAKKFKKIVKKINKKVSGSTELLNDLVDSMPAGEFRYVDGMQFAENLLARHA